MILLLALVMVVLGMGVLWGSIARLEDHSMATKLQEAASLMDPFLGPGPNLVEALVEPVLSAPDEPLAPLLPAEEAVLSPELNANR